MDIETLVEDKIIEKQVESYNLVVYNDDVNTFDHVIESLIQVCKHNSIQAEQCTMLIHYKGKCEVKSGGMKELTGMCSALLDCGISAEIQ